MGDQLAQRGVHGGQSANHAEKSPHERDAIGGRVPHQFVLDGIKGLFGIRQLRYATAKPPGLQAADHLTLALRKVRGWQAGRKKKENVYHLRVLPPAECLQVQIKRARKIAFHRAEAAEIEEG